MLCAYCFTKTESLFKDFNDTCMDGYSCSNLLEHLDYIFQMCPKCMAVSDNLSKYADDKEYAEFVFEKYKNCDEYQAIANNAEIATLEKKLLLAEILYKHSIDMGAYNSDMDLTLFVFYYQKGLNEKAKKYLNNKTTQVQLMIENLKKYYETNQLTQDVLRGCLDEILVLIDMYRLISDFDNAMQYINMLKSYKFNKYTRNAKERLKLQEQLCKKKNCQRVLAPKIKDSVSGIIY